MHKKVHWLVWCGMLFLAACRTTNQTEKMESGDTPQARSVYEQGEHIICHKGEISLSRVVRPLFADDFRLDSGVWENFENHESRLSVKYDQYQGIAGLILRRGAMGGQDTG